MKNHTRQKKFRHATSLLVNCSSVLHVKAPILHAAIFGETNTMSIWWTNMVGHEMVAAHVCVASAIHPFGRHQIGKLCCTQISSLCMNNTCKSPWSGFHVLICSKI